MDRDVLRALTSGDVNALIDQRGLPTVRRFVQRFKDEGLIVGDLRQSLRGHVRSMVSLTEHGQAYLER